ncbi:peptidoglycan-binding protein [Anaerobacillus sp. CMMVII]|uniref:L,D-transpeptidase family protein n=1 Tax=Anaerobacillus sp. CMMVII TaxID=2755588 RepID=UPI0021B76B16|nr:L,D-transpeptidase family protein [Anaerobacillus sp. CMMVII]MCT8137681.1 peptidoglycan-binding protein [Anaerobacillus sp. CMMVII]
MKKLVIFSIIICFFFSFWLPQPTNASSGQLIIINKASNELAYYENNKLNRIFSVGTGKSASLTPEGNFKIVNKIVERPYYKDNIPGGDPKNPLGARWLGLNARGTWGTTYAIHGNANPASIGGYVSLGCVRMHNDEVIWLFDQVAIDTPVVIVNSSSSFDNIALANGHKITASTKGSAPTINKGTVLQLGSKGDQVKDLQNTLKILGYDPGEINGSFNEKTELAVRTFQHEHGLLVDGIIGGQTIRALRNPPKKVAVGAPPPKQEEPKPTTPEPPKQEPTEQQKPVTPVAPKPDVKEVEKIQNNLKKLGYYMGEVDIIWGNSRSIK